MRAEARTRVIRAVVALAVLGALVAGLYVWRPSGLYLWFKAVHVIAVISWMAGMLYLPRLFVYHVERVTAGSATDWLFQTMEGKLYRVIMTPAMVAAWVFGLALVATPGVVDWAAAWPWLKAVAVLAMSGFHLWLGRCRAAFAAGTNRRSGRGYRMMNELPTLLMVAIVVAVIVRF